MCSNCHQRADSEKWGEKTLRAYKLRPWIMRQNNFDCEHEGAFDVTIVEISIDMEIKDFDDYKADMFRHALAGFLRIPPGRVRIITKKEGSVKLLVELPESYAEKLIDAFETGSAELAEWFPLFEIQHIERTQPRSAKAVIGARTASAIEEFLHNWSAGDTSALEKLIPLVYKDLRAIASRLVRRESGSVDLLEPAALVNEVYLRLIDQQQVQWQNREMFFAVAALLMRRFLIDHAKWQTVKRGSGSVKIPLDEAIGIPQAVVDLDIEALDEALSRLAEIEPRQSRIVELRFFVGLSYEEIAGLLGISVSTVKRDWRTARLWLTRELTTK